MPWTRNRALRYKAPLIGKLTAAVPPPSSSSLMDLERPFMHGLLLGPHLAVRTIWVLADELGVHPICHEGLLVSNSLRSDTPPLPCGLTDHPIDVGVEIVDPGVLRARTRDVLAEVAGHARRRDGQCALPTEWTRLRLHTVRDRSTRLEQDPTRALELVEGHRQLSNSFLRASRSATCIRSSGGAPFTAFSPM